MKSLKNATLDISTSRFHCHSKTDSNSHASSNHHHSYGYCHICTTNMTFTIPQCLKHKTLYSVLLETCKFNEQRTNVESGRRITRQSAICCVIWGIAPLDPELIIATWTFYYFIYICLYLIIHFFNKSVQMLPKRRSLLVGKWNTFQLATS